MLRLSKLFFIIFITVNFSAEAQYLKDNPRSSNSLLFPINPGTPNSLSGSMGELRSSHFHTGIDIRTGGQEGLAVLAADDGYLSRVKIKPGGYGNTIYIKHPNGHTTVYAHLKSFRPDIAAYVRKQQYEKKTFSIDLYTDKDLFRFSRGDTIAVSGNSGSSGGPHLHFDVRNRNQDLLNPLHYGFKEITDTRPPLAKELALVTTTIESSVNGEFGRIVIPFEYEKNKYFIRDTVNAIGKIGLELFAYDRMTNTRFKTGLNRIEIRVNNSIHMITTIDSWSFSKSRQFYTYINYEALANKGKRFHKLYIDEGNHLPFYSKIINNGYLNIEQGKTYSVEIKIKDSYENESNVNFVINGTTNNAKSFDNTIVPTTSWRLEKNNLILKTNLEDTLRIYTKGKAISLEPLFVKNKHLIYIWELKKGLIDSISINGRTENLNIVALVPTGIDYKLYNPVADVQFAKNTLFSNLFVTLSSKTDTTSGFEIVTIGNSTIPLNKSFTMNYKPSTAPLNKKYWHMYSVWGKSSAFIGGRWKGDQISFKTRSFGNYTLKADSIPPEIKPLTISSDELVFKITDNLSGIKTINMNVNNQWILMNYDPKRNLIWAEKPRADYIYKEALVLKVTDNSGNERIHSTKIQ